MLAAVELPPRQQCFLVVRCIAVVDVDFVGRPILVDRVVDLSVLLLVGRCAEIPVYLSSLDRNTTIPRRIGCQGSGVHFFVDLRTRDLGSHNALGC